MLRDLFEDLIEKAEALWESFSDRERQLVSVTGIVALFVIVLLPLFLFYRSMSELEEHNEKAAQILRDLEHDRPKIMRRLQEKRQSEARYANKAPSLASLYEDKARASGLTIKGDVTDQPERKLPGFKVRGLRVKVPNVGLRAWVQLVASLDSTSFPIALDYLRVEHFKKGDVYDVEIGIVAYDRLP